jgi:N-acetylmuramoyl-L-alanine amidase
MNIIQELIPVGRRNRPARQNPMTYITIHNTGNTARTAGARNHASYIKGDAAAALPVSWHYTVDDKEVICHIPDNEDAFHAGDGAGNGNRRSIGIEICMNEGGDLLKATDNAVWLTANLCKKYNISLDRVVQHNRWSGKNCPQLIRAGKPYSWDTFIEKVQKALTPPPVPAPTPVPPAGGTAGAAPPPDRPSAWAKEVCDRAVESGLILGDGRGNFGWREPVTLERMLVLLDKLVEFPR